MKVQNRSAKFLAAWGVSVLLILPVPAGAAIIYDSGDDGTANGGLLVGIAPAAIQALGSTIITGEYYHVTSIGVYVESVDVNGALDLMIMPTAVYEGFDNASLPDPLDRVTSPFTARLDSLAEGLNSISVDWDLAAGTWFLAAFPVLETPGLEATLSGAVTPAAVNAFYGNNPYWSPDEGTTPSFVLEGAVIPEPSAVALLLGAAGVFFLMRQRGNKVAVVA